MLSVCEWTIQPFYAFQMIFTALAPRLIQSIGRNAHNKNGALKQLCLALGDYARA